MSRPFVAKFPSSCGACDQQIVAGQWVAFIDDDLVHDKCPPRPPTCPTCFVELPVTGICEECAP